MDFDPNGRLAVSWMHPSPFGRRHQSQCARTFMSVCVLSTCHGGMGIAVAPPGQPITVQCRAREMSPGILLNDIAYSETELDIYNAFGLRDSHLVDINIENVHF